MSKRQNTLYERMKSAKERFIKIKKALDTMLLNKLHNHEVYTLNQFNKVYITRTQANKVYKHIKNNERQSANDQQDSEQ